MFKKYFQIFVLLILFFLNVYSVQAACYIGDNCSTCSEGGMTYGCVDINSRPGGQLECYQGMCSGGSNIQCCPTTCPTGKTCKDPSIGTNCEGIGLCPGAQQCCADSAQEAGVAAGVGKGGILEGVNFDSVDGFIVLLINVANFILSLVGAVSLLFFVYGGFTWILSGGNSTAVDKGKTILKNSIIGIVIVFAAYALINFIMGSLVDPGGSFMTSGWFK